MPRAPANALTLPSQVDIAIVTILQKEYDAVKRRLKNWRYAPGMKDQPNQYAWGVGEIEAANGGTYQVALAMTFHPGNTSGTLGTGKTVERWHPRYVLLVGIAGGLPREQLGLGDVVVSKQIVSYEYGKVQHNAFYPRPDFVYQLDGALLRSASSLSEADWRNGLGRRPVADRKKPKLRVGMVGSGDKVIDDRSADFFAAVEDKFPKLLAVEMEGAGAAAAIQEAKDAGLTVGFLMIRGISDMPPNKIRAKKPAAGKNDAPAMSDRDQWTIYAANAAASFAIYLISHAWPLPPRGANEAEPGGGSVGAARTAPQSELLAHLKMMKIWAETNKGHDRTAYDLRSQPVRISSSISSEAELFNAGAVCYFFGWSGRGKTTTLRLLAGQAIEESPPRVPLLLPFETAEATLLSETRAALQLSVPFLDSDHDVRSWLSTTPALFLVDDWHKLSERQRRSVERAITQLSLFPARMVIAGAPGVPPPGVARQLELRRYDHQERDALIEAHVGQNWGRTRYILDNLPSGFAELLCEPVLLAIFLDAIRFSTTGGLHFPQDLFALVREFLLARLRSRHENYEQRWDEYSVVCQGLAKSAGPISIAILNQARQEHAVESTPAELAENLCAVGVLERRGVTFVFAHEIWRSYFRIAALSSTTTLTTIDGVRDWVTATAEMELRIDLPFVGGALSDMALEDAFHDALLSRSLELYFRALATRGAATTFAHDKPWELSCLERVHAGYFRLIERHFAGLARLLDPWIRGDRTEERRGLKPVTVGAVSQVGLQYHHGFGSIAGPDAIQTARREFDRGRQTYAPANGIVRRMTNLSLSGQRPDSGRLISAKVLLKEVRELLKAHTLPAIGWIARERFLSQARIVASASDWEKDWSTWTVNAVQTWLAAQRAQIYGEHPDSRPPQIVFGEYGRHVEIDDFEESIVALVREGHGERRVQDLELPGPDRGRDGSIAYSRARKVARVKALFSAIADTYRLVCERCFPTARTHFLFAQFPCRAVVRVDTAKGPRASWQVCWEVVREWDEDPLVELVRGRPSWRDLDERAEVARNTCAELGRPYIDFTATETGGKYWPYQPVVTKWVADLLEDDIKRVERWLANAT